MGEGASVIKDKESVIHSGIAGGVAGCVAKTVVAPLDRVKILFQASSPEYNKYAGPLSDALSYLPRIFPYAAINFLAYDEAHNVLPTHAQETNLRRFSAGAISSIISVSFTYPLELLRVRMAFQTIYSPTSGCPTQLSFLRTTCLIYSEGVPLKSTGAPITRDPFRTLPLLKFYRGFTASLVGITTSYPFEVVRQRMQVGGPTKHGQWLHGGETVRAMWARGGPKGFFVGLGIGYLKIIPDERERQHNLAPLEMSAAPPPVVPCLVADLHTIATEISLENPQ
ncbi:mitochondrial carrier domain-containing protein [Lactarius indigo]|nr:mitochondrial carrier domain-containing protein [Lactarius indigo]